MTLTPEAFQEKKPEHLKLKSLWGMCSVPVAKRRRGGVRQRQRDETPSDSDETDKDDTVVVIGGKDAQTSFLGNNILLDWSWGFIRSARARELAASFQGSKQSQT